MKSIFFKILFFLITISVLISCTNSEKKAYYPNGVLRCSIPIINELKAGEAYYYDSLGNIESVVNYKNDKYDGYFKEFYPNGQLKTIAFFIDGIRNDTNKTFYSNGKMESILYYKNGKREGRYKHYYESGNPHLLAIFENDKSVYYMELNEKKKVIGVNRINEITCKDSISINDILICKIKVYGLLNDGLKIKISVNEKVDINETVMEIEHINGNATYKWKPIKKGIFYVNCIIHVADDEIYFDNKKVVVY
ncbi:MAG: hypothetical protein CVU05_12140 [Bacteroidetes bacterium HGW-Bacteroidetes-21]|nr:MAG: hypothetical protein CVU05_12140 [Bacteroidetes bacterium HGW-Bacteroidetes-21]